MSRVKLSEFKAKKLINPVYEGFEISPDSKLPKLDSKKRYVLKVDQAEKGRFKKGLVKLDVTHDEVEDYLKELRSKGYEYYLIEPMTNHVESDEMYLSLTYDAGRTIVLFSERGGIDIETAQDTIKSWSFEAKPPKSVSKEALNFINHLKLLMDKYHIAFLEINPMVVQDGKVQVLDCAMEVDNAAEFFVKQAWTSHDFRRPVGKVTQEEKEVELINSSSPATFTLSVLNKNGSIFTLLLGGGASLVLADSLIDKFGLGALANYAESSGGPSRKETKLYVYQILKLLLKSKARKKAIVLAGSVANFSDVVYTFSGFIDAYKELSSELSKQNITVFVRRGGPRQKEGLKMIEEFLESVDVPAIVCGPGVGLGEFVATKMEVELT